MAAEVDNSQYSSYRRASKQLSLRTSIRRTSPTAPTGIKPGQESPEQQAAEDREVLLNWIRLATELLTVWHEHFTRRADLPIERAEIEKFIVRLSEVKNDIAENLYSADSILSRLGYAERVALWEVELAGPWEQLTDALYPYRNSLRRVNLASLRDNPAGAMEFDEIAYVKSKAIRQLFAQYRNELGEQVAAIQNLLEHGR
jgi:hypothetical protein